MSSSAGKLYMKVIESGPKSGRKSGRKSDRKYSCSIGNHKVEKIDNTNIFGQNFFWDNFFQKYDLSAKFCI